MIRWALVIWLGWAGSVAGQCRQALALALDVSGSVDAREYRLQLDGLALALDDAQVRAALTSNPAAPVRLLVFEWSGPEDQVVLVPWTAVTGPGVIDGIIATLRGTARREASPGTGLGTAMQRGTAELGRQGDCWRRTLDISGDGKSNLGPRPRDVKPGVAAAGVTVNGLVIGADNPDIGDLRQTEIGELSAYFRAEVIVGADAFVETALGYDDYADAMTVKLLRELDGLVLSRR